MLAAQTHRSPRLPLLAPLILAACSVLPEPSRPAYRDEEVAVRCVVPESGRLRVPATTRDVVVRSLIADPPPRGEAYGDDGARWLLYDEGARVLVRAQLRLYGADANDDRYDRAALFPEAVQWLPTRGLRAQ